MDQANANLERNVRWHNKKLKSLQIDADDVYKDDVIGAAVTANNASARLSSLRVQAEQPDDQPEGSSSEEDDSGYRESNESREETSSTSASDLTELNGAPSAGEVLSVDPHVAVYSPFPCAILQVVESRSLRRATCASFAMIYLRSGAR
jgi:hypothetical protein